MRLCTRCGHETLQPLRKKPGSAWVSLVLAVPFIIPGLAYETWRIAMRRPVCPRCDSAALIPGDSPLARTWRAAGWITASAGVVATDDRFERIEQAIDAMSLEIERMRTHPSPSLRGDSGERDLRLRGPVTPH